MNIQNNNLSKILRAVGLSAVLISPSAMAGLYAVDLTGSISSYDYWLSDDPFSGSIGVGTEYSARYTIAPDAVDLRAANDWGVYTFDSDQTSFSDYTANIGGNHFASETARVTVFNDYRSSATNSGLDFYAGWSINITPDELLLMAVILIDPTATALSNDDFIAEPVLSDFQTASFRVVSYDLLTMNMNYLIRGSVDTLIDPPIDSAVSVPEPSTVLLLGIALVGFGVAQRKRQQS